MMNPETVSNNIRKNKNDYRKLSKTLKARCDEISKDNDALSSRLIRLKLLICKAENQSRNLQERLEKHGVDYHAAILAYSSNDFNKEEEREPTMKSAKSKTKLNKRNQSKPSESVSLHVKEDPGM